jgi:hypothetical protein
VSLYLRPAASRELHEQPGDHLAIVIEYRIERRDHLRARSGSTKTKIVIVLIIVSDLAKATAQSSKRPEKGGDTLPTIEFRILRFGWCDVARRHRRKSRQSSSTTDCGAGFAAFDSSE